MNKTLNKMLCWLFPLPKEMTAPAWMKAGSITRISKINMGRIGNPISLNGVKFNMKGKV